MHDPIPGIYLCSRQVALAMLVIAFSCGQARAQLLDRAPAQEKVAIFERATPAAERLQMFDRALVERMNIANEKSTPAMEKASATN